MNWPVSLVIAVNTVKGYARDRLFYGIIVFAILFVMFAYLLATLTIIEQRKIILDFGLSAISLGGIVLAIFVGLNSVGKEIDNKTIYTILSKPVSRFAYILGKFLGCAIVCIFTQMIMELVLGIIIQGAGEVMPVGIFGCYYLMALESILILSVAIFFSLSISSSFLAGTLTMGIFLIGRSTTTIAVIMNHVNSTVGRFFLRFVNDIFPALGRFSVRELVAYGKIYPHEILLSSTLYTFLYISIFLFAAISFFYKKDLR